MRRVHNTLSQGLNNTEVRTQEGMIRERYVRCYPSVPYYSLQEGFPVPQEGDVAQRTQQGVVDDLWGEEQPAPEGIGLDWQQPHTTDTLDATKGVGCIFMGEINAKIIADPPEKVLKTHGVVDERAVVITFPKCLLRELNIEVKIGDQFEFEGQRYKIAGWKPKGYFSATSYYFYVEAAATYSSVGS